MWRPCFQLFEEFFNLPKEGYANRRSIIRITHSFFRVEEDVLFQRIQVFSDWPAHGAANFSIENQLPGMVRSHLAFILSASRKQVFDLRSKQNVCSWIFGQTSDYVLCNRARTKNYPCGFDLIIIRMSLNPIICKAVIFYQMTSFQTLPDLERLANQTKDYDFIKTQAYFLRRYMLNYTCQFLQHGDMNARMAIFVYRGLELRTVWSMPIGPKSHTISRPSAEGTPKLQS